MLTITHDVETRQLTAGDGVVWNNGEAYIFDHIESEEGSDYVRVFWRDGNFTFSTTAQPWNTWPTVFRTATSRTLRECVTVWDERGATMEAQDLSDLAESMVEAVRMLDED